MSGDTPDRDDELIRFAALLDQFSAEQRAAALTQSKKQRITVVRNVGQVAQITFETVVDEGSAAAEIYALLAPIDNAIDRLKAKSDLSDHYNMALNNCGELEVAVRKRSAMRHGFDAANAVHNASRRSARVGLTSQQIAGLEEQSKTINDLFDKIEDRLRAAEECRRILDGEDPFALLRDKVEQRLDMLRGHRSPEAA